MGSSSFTTNQFFISILILLLFIALGYLLKQLFFKKYEIPISLIAGMLAFLVGPELLGTKIGSLSPDFLNLPEGLLPVFVVKIWKELPVYLITLVFASLFLGKSIPGIKSILKLSSPNLVYGYTLAVGQYVVGLLTALLILHPFLGNYKMVGALLPIGFQGGHGTVAGLKSTFESLEFSRAYDLGLGVATMGLLAAIIAGTLMSNLSQTQTEEEEEAASKKSDKQIVSSFSFSLALIGISIVLGWIILTAIQELELMLSEETGFRIAKYVPLFPVAMIGGLIVQTLLGRWNMEHHLKRQHVNKISGLALDLLIVAAIGSLSVEVLSAHWVTLLILAGVGIAYNILLYFTVAKAVFGKNWRKRGLGELGQSMGTTAIGLVLIKNEGGKSEQFADAFSYKQPLYEPIVGGGLVTAIALPLINQVGVIPVLLVMSTVLAGFFVLAYLLTKT